MPPKQTETMPTPEDIIEAGERLADVVRRVWASSMALPQSYPRMVLAVIGDVVRSTIEEARRQRQEAAASFRSPG